jgi:cell wall-active antibiotic response 4TMS protein YvqF
MTIEDPSKPEKKSYERRTSDLSLRTTALILIAAAVVFFALNGRPSSASARETLTNDPTFSGTAVLSGIERRISSSDFRGAEASAFMGGVTLDFRDAAMKGNEAEIDVSAIMGGIEIRVPRTWIVINRVTPIMGGVEDHTHSTDGNKRLVIEGTVFMGGLEIKN